MYRNEEAHPKGRYENFEGGETLFPHIYGSINPDAVVDTIDFKPDIDGTFRLPHHFQKRISRQ